MTKIISKQEKTTTIFPDGNEETTILETTTSFQKNNEPDYIKLYTKMWCEFNQIPVTYQELFLQLVIRMSYCNSSDLENSQLVNTGKPWSTSIMKTLNWKERMYLRGLKELCNCGAIKKVGKGVYQINPNYAGKGEWKYNPRLNRGGIEDLVAIFRFKDNTVEAKMIWADDGTDNELNELFRAGINVTKKQESVLKTTKRKVN